MADDAPDIPDQIVQNSQSAADAVGLGQGSLTPQPVLKPPSATQGYGMPALISMIGQMIHPTATLQPGQMPRAPSRLDAFEHFLGNFTMSLAQGMAASGSGPGANIRGAAGALNAPHQAAMQQYQLQRQQQEDQARVAQQQAQTEATQAQAQLVPVKLADGTEVQLPASIAKTMIDAQVAAAAKQNVATTQTGGRVKAAEIGVQGKEAIVDKTIASKEKLAKMSEQDKFALTKYTMGVRQAIAGANQELQREKANGPTAATRTMGEQAKNLLPQLDRIDGMISKMSDNLGPVKGRWNQWVTQGYDGKDPEMANLLQSMSLLRTGMMRAHVGARGGVGLLAEFERNLNAGMTPEALKGSLQGMREFLQTYANEAGSGVPGGGNPTAGGNRVVDLRPNAGR